MEVSIQLIPYCFIYWQPRFSLSVFRCFNQLSCFIPCAGIQLKDLIALHTVLPDTVNGGLINVQKMTRLASIMSPLVLAQTTQPPVQPNLELIKMLRVSLTLISYLIVRFWVVPWTAPAGASNTWDTCNLFHLLAVCALLNSPCLPQPLFIYSPLFTHDTWFTIKARNYTVQISFNVFSTDYIYMTNVAY